ncbi:YkvA family protein [Aeromicrobium sp. Root236]|uniref:YkvA family protein n=1 Tax=Aeromicrobium sp. Root236 TaxID=1736498 RepID=UPI0009E72488|nr:YkvA family protein [Aeromicrobium sp. Root236]
MSDTSGIPAKKSSAKKAAAKKSPAKKAAAKKSPAKKAAAKKSPAKKTAAKKSPATKTAAKKSPAKKAAAKKSPAKKAAAKKTASARLKTTRRAATTRLRKSSSALAKSAPSSKFFKNARKRAGSIIQNPEKLKKLAADSASRAGDRSGPFEEVLGDLKAMIRMVTSYAKGDYRQISTDTLLLVVAALVYVVSPIDLIPDAIPGVGLLDDVTVVVWVVGRVKNELDAFRSWEETR